MSLKVIGAGLPRTGTVSLRIALQKLLGGHCHHGIELLTHPQQVELWHKASAGQKIDWGGLLSGYVASVDAPASLFWRELMQVYPDALVLLSYRDPKVWAESCRNSIFFESCRRALHNETTSNDPPGDARPRLAALDQPQIYDPTVISTLSDDPLGFIGKIVLEYLQIDFDPRQYEASAMQAFERHNAAVKAGVPAERLLLWQAKDGWEPICSALKLHIPNEPFPHANKAGEYRRVMRYVGFAERVIGRRLTSKLINSLSRRFGYG